MRPNSAKQLLLEGQPAIGIFVSAASPLVAEAVGRTGLAWVCVDMQHGEANLGTLSPLLTAISATPAMPYARVAVNDFMEIGRALDLGAYGIIVPLVNTAAEAEAAVRAAKYPPRGNRSHGPIRGALYGGPDYFGSADQETSLVVMIETRDGVEQAEQILAAPSQETSPLGERARAAGRGRRGLITAAWTAPGAVWLVFYLLIPVVMIVLVSFWTRTVSGFESVWTLDNYESLFRSNVYWDQLWDSFWHSLVIVAAALILGFPVAYFLAISVTSLRMQIALFIVALAPFWTSYLIRAVAWIPMMGRQGALNTGLQELGLIDEPLDILLFSDFAVTVAMLQLYILFMIAPLFFMLAQIDRSSLEAARDLGANSFKTFREVILPQAMPGVVIGSIFVFILTMGEFATVRIIGGGQVASVGTIVQTQVASVQFPQAAASAVFLVVAMFLGVFVLLRFSNLREEL